MVNNWDVFREGRELASAWTEMVSEQETLGDYRLGKIVGADQRVQAFCNKHSTNSVSAGFRPLVVSEFRDVYVNNIGNYVLSGVMAESEFQLADFRQQSQQYLSGAQPARVDGRHTVEIDYACVLMRPGDHIYGHWLVDILPRLWLLSRLHDLSSIVFVLRAGCPAFASKMLYVAGVPAKNVVYFDPSAENLFLRRGIYVSNLRADQTVHPIISSFADWWAGRLLARLPKRPSFLGAMGDRKRIFVSRGMWRKPHAHRICINAEVIEEYLLRSAGVQIFHPQDLDLPEQVAIFRNAEVLIGEEGSGLHNSIFARDGSHVITLRGPMNHSLIQSGLCRAKNQTLHAALGQEETSLGDGREANFSISTDQVDQLVTELASA